MVIQQDSAATDSKLSTQEHRQQLSHEIGNLQAEVVSIRQQHEHTVEALVKEKEIAEAKISKLQKQLEKIKNAPKQASSVVIDLPLQGARSENNFHRDTVSGDSNESHAALQKQVKNLKQEIELIQEENRKLSDQVKRLRRENLEI